MKSSGKLGKIFLGCEVANISPFGVWVLVSGNEYFLDHKKFPWFKGAAVEDVLNVESPRTGHLRWLVPRYLGASQDPLRQCAGENVYQLSLAKD